MTTTNCTAYNGSYQDLHDHAAARNEACPACQPARIDPREVARENRSIARAARAER